MRGPFFGSDKAAAEYCGMSLTTFKRHKKTYAIERRAGPTRRQYAASDLDAFMENPEQFRKVTFHHVDHLTLEDLGFGK